MSKCGGEWIQICQKILRSQTSMDFADFLYFLKFIRNRRLDKTDDDSIKDLDVIIPLIDDIQATRSLILALHITNSCFADLVKAHS